MPNARLLSAEEFLLATLMGKLAVMAALATMLARYRRFRHILIFERRDWPDRLVFALGLAVPLTAGVASRDPAQLRRRRPDARRRVSRGPDRRPLHRRHRRRCMAFPALAAANAARLPFAVGCGFAGGGLREACPKEAHLALLAVRLLQPAPLRLAHGAELQSTGRSCCCSRRSAWSSSGRWSAPRFGEHRLFYLRRAAPWLTRGRLRDRADGRHADQDLEQRAHRAPAAGTGEAAARGEGRGARRARSTRTSSSTR